MIGLLVFSILGVAHGIDPSADAEVSTTGSQSPLQTEVSPLEKVHPTDSDILGPNTFLLADNGTYFLPSRSQMEMLASVRGHSKGSSGIPAHMQEVLDLHNLYRCMHQAPLMNWDETIAENAQAHADRGAWGHSSRQQLNLEGIGQLGENIAWGFPDRSGIDATEAWYAEIALTDGTPENCDDRNQGETGDICHYTQVVWKASTKLGCGKGRAMDGDFWVCQYGAAGNEGGAFTQNVEAPSKTEQECENVSPPPPLAPTPALVPTPTPTPAVTLVEETKDDDCVDKAAHESPVIYDGSGPAECKDIEWACPLYSFVVAKCKFTCNSC